MKRKKRIIVEGKIAKVELSQGREAIIDREDVERVREISWCVHRDRIGSYYVTGELKNNRLMTMSRLLMRARKGEIVLFINGDTLDCRKENLYIGQRRKKVIIEGDVAKIELTQGFWAVVDIEDVERIKKLNWSAMSKDGYCRARAKRGGKFIYMHREVMGVRESKRFVDHIDGNALNNRKANLRICSPKENNRNRRMSRNNRSGYKGVSFSKQSGKWKAGINKGKKMITLGFFEEAEEAARAYDRAAREFHGDFALTNESLGLLVKEKKSSRKGAK